jgi:hypothetical protein
MKLAMLSLIKKLFFATLILMAFSLVSFAQTQDDKKPPKPTPPIIKIPPKPNDGTKPKDPPNGEVKPKKPEEELI